LPDSAACLEQEVRLALGHAARDGRSDAGRLVGIESVHVEREVEARSALRDDGIASFITRSMPRMSSSRIE
jgi:hypothetical protein